MGYFDTVNMLCPKCQDMYSEQTKAGYCAFDTFDLNKPDYPNISSWLRCCLAMTEQQFKCNNCGQIFEVLMTQIPQFSTSSDYCRAEIETEENNDPRTST